MQTVGKTTQWYYATRVVEALKKIHVEKYNWKIDTIAIFATKYPHAGTFLQANVLALTLLRP